MKSAENLAIAVRIYPPLTILDPASNRIIGPFSGYYGKWLSLFNPWNTTYVAYSEDYGTCPTGDCDGLLGIIQEGKADISLVSYPVNLLDPNIVGIQPGPVLQAIECGITSSVPGLEVIDHDVYNTFDLFISPMSLFILTLLALLSTLIVPVIIHFSVSNQPFSSYFRGPLRSKVFIWPYIHTFLGIDASSIAGFSRPINLKSLFLSTSLASTLLTAIYFGSFTTDLTSQPEVRKIETIQDILGPGRNKIPIVNQSGKCKLFIERGIHSSYKRLQRRLIYTKSNFQQLLTDNSLERYVILASKEEISRNGIALCNTMSTTLTGPDWYESLEPFEASLNIVLVHAHISAHKRTLITVFYNRIFASQVVIRIESSLKLAIHNMYKPSDDDGCLYRTSIKRTPYDLGNSFKPLIFDNYDGTLVFYVAVLALAVLVFTVECLSTLAYPHWNFRSFQNHSY